MEKSYTHARTCVYNLTYHIVWCVRYRRNVLNPQHCDRLCQLVRQIGEEKGFTVTDCSVVDGRDIHCLVTAPPKISVTQIVKYLKGISANALLAEFPEIKPMLWGGQLWNGSYFCETAGDSCEESVRTYLEQQENVRGDKELEQSEDYMLANAPVCPNCQVPTKLCIGKYGYYYRCSNADCEYTRKVLLPGEKLGPKSQLREDSFVRKCANCEFNFGTVCAGGGPLPDGKGNTYGMPIEECIKLFPGGCLAYARNPLY